MLVGAWLLLDFTRFTFAQICHLCFNHSKQAHVRSLLLLSLPFIAPDKKHAQKTASHYTQSKCAVSMNQISFDDDEAFEALDLISERVASKIVHVHPVSRLEQRTYFQILGRTSPECTRFSVDFTCGTRSLVDGTIAFHFNPRLQEGYVVRNCLLKGYWGDEETTSPTPFSLRPNEDFELIFYITRSEFNVSVNGRHFCSFRHRVHYERITSIDFVGNLSINQCSPRSAHSYPFIWDTAMGAYDIPLDVNFSEDDDLKLPVPFLGKLSQHLNIGSQIEICGKVKLLPHSFYVNLQEGTNLVPHAVIPLHLNPRFSASCGANAFVRNAWSDGQWCSEERAPGFPFSPGYSFCLIIRFEMNFYGIWVNDKLIAEYPYRVPNKHMVDAVYIQGDVYLRHISVNQRSRYSQYGFHAEKSVLRL